MTGTHGETPTFVGVSFCLAASARCRQPIRFRGSTKPFRGFKPSSIRDAEFGLHDGHDPADHHRQRRQPGHHHRRRQLRDLGATVSDTGPGQAGDTDLGITTFLNGMLVSNIVIDTSEVATDTIDCVATDENGLTAISARTVIIEAAATSSSQ